MSSKEVSVDQLASVTAMLKRMIQSPRTPTRSPHLDFVRDRRDRIEALRDRGYTWPEILPKIFHKDAPTLRTFKRLWAQVIDES